MEGSSYLVHGGEPLSVKKQMLPLRQVSEQSGIGMDQWVCFKFISWAQIFAMSRKTALCMYNISVLEMSVSADSRSAQPRDPQAGYNPMLRYSKQWMVGVEDSRIFSEESLEHGFVRSHEVITARLPNAHQEKRLFFKRVCACTCTEHTSLSGIEVINEIHVKMPRNCHRTCSKVTFQASQIAGEALAALEFLFPSIFTLPQQFRKYVTSTSRITTMESTPSHVQFENDSKAKAST
ncbi:hypothetical protein TRIATDRAFT_88760 [Trichoderma atroviride IMI 206040]|uniref:Uncharacterized protein n=1 Tax=Hypocrea atroviridis (strain ATCC 20476 / IMI 206040) TaxID=452589 RepID=G9NUX1_HYPAI|nr:uncharacterized protein TRIATDRAFT_88760 [Trichoderma atroviride IMI 206040]EHK45845.1 hypothetical protein TRIATDRAFT_88760 [Trichoderma atroviride IMI 206040]